MDRIHHRIVPITGLALIAMLCLWFGSWTGPGGVSSASVRLPTRQSAALSAPLGLPGVKLRQEVRW